MTNTVDRVNLYTNKNCEQKNLEREEIHGMQIWDFCWLVGCTRLFSPKFKSYHTEIQNIEAFIVHLIKAWTVSTPILGLDS